MAATRPAAHRQHQHDEIRYCERCGISFFRGVEEQRAAGMAAASGAAVAPRFCPGCRALLPPANRERALVKWYSMRKRYGFLVRRDQPEIFVPAASLEGRGLLLPGDLVEFSPGENEQGPVALHVRVLAAAEEIEAPLDAPIDLGARRNPAARKNRANPSS